MDVILRMRKVTERTGLAKSTIYQKIAENEFPPQIRLSPKAVGWLERDIQNWIEAQISKSSNDNFSKEKTKQEK